MSHGKVGMMNSSARKSLVQAMPPIHLPTCKPVCTPVDRLSLGSEVHSGSPSPVELDSVKLGVEGWASLSAGVGSQRNLQEYFQESSTAADEDSHLVEFSDALQTVARALRQVAESKARTQQEAAEWKRKYELEVVRCQQLRQNVTKKLGVDVEHGDPPKEVVVEAIEQQDSDSPNGMHSPPHGNGVCCSKEGICSQQVIRAQGTTFFTPESENCSDKKRSSEKASFRLAWGGAGAGKSSRRHKHDIVSFESGNITTVNRSSKQITLEWDSPPQSVFILLKPNSNSVALMCKEMVRWLTDVKGLGVFMEKNVKKDFVEEDLYFSCVQVCERDEDLLTLHRKVDLVITLGGDGTVLWAANMFKGPVPPLVSFSMGSLGFMTPFPSDRYKECLETVMRGPVFITLRHRLHCRIIRNKDNDDNGDDVDNDHLVLNEVSIDRGMSSYLTNLECYCDNLFVTCVQGDGLILSTPSGSTAYSLAAGGSMVHPQVPGILFTPICPHSLSFRPLILPEYVTLRVQIPINSRGQAWASFDGKDRQKLSAGDALIVHMSAWPVPAACDEESTNDFLRSVREGLHWNLRKSQSFDGPREAVVHNS